MKLKYMNNLNSKDKKEKLTLAGRLARVFVYNKVLSLLVIFIIIIWGLLSFVLMPKQYNPEIIAPAFLITTDYPGASSEEVYNLITRPMEDKISELNQIDSISSQSVSGGRSTVMVKFDVGSNQEAAKISINQKLQDNINLKPLTANEPIVKSIDPNDVPILDIGISSNQFSESSLRKIAFEIADEIKLVDGVAKVEVIGGRKNNLNIFLKSEELIARGISLPEIESAILSSNNIYTVDIINREDGNKNINIIGNIDNVDDLKKIIVKTNSGSMMRLGEIAEVEYDFGEINNYVYLKNKDLQGRAVVHIALSKLKNKNATTVSDEVKQRLADLRDNKMTDGVEMEVLKDEGEISRKEIGKLTFDLIKSIFIVALLLVIFLGFRNSMVATISIPLILLAVFAFGLLWGETVNRITLFALILALGLLVDDAIVVIENISRYFGLYPKKNKKELIVESVDEVGSALFLSTVIMALAFLPMSFVTGMMGPYMGPIPFFVPVSLFVSLFLSVTINPFLANLFSSKGESEKNPNIFLRAFSRLENYYGNFLEKLLFRKDMRQKFIFSVFGIFIISVLFILTPLVPFRMLPKADRDQFYIYLDFQDGVEVDNNKEKTATVENILLSNKFVQSVESFVGTAPVVDFNGLFKGSSLRFAENQTTLKVNLVSHEERDIESEKIATDFREKIADFKRSNPGVEVKIVEDPPGPPVLSTFFLKIKGEEDEVRESIALSMFQKSKSIDGIVDLSIEKPDYPINYIYKIDLEKAQKLDVNPQLIAKIIKTGVSGSNISTIHFANKSKDIHEEEYLHLRLDKDSRNTLEKILALEVSSQSGKSVPLSELIVFSDKTFSQPIISDERREATYILGEMENRSVVYASIDLLKELRTYIPQEGNLRLVNWSLYGVKYKDLSSGKYYEVEIDGEWRLTLEVFRDLGVAMLVAIFIIYFILAIKIKSFNVPILIMVSIPLGFIGIFPGFAVLYFLKGTYFNATSMIGIIALAGLSVKNSVIFLEYLEPLLKRGEDLRNSLIKTGRVRLLPIVLTSLTAILGSLTIVTDPVWEGLAWAIIFGLSASTFLTLVVFPVIYYMAKDNN